MAKRQILKATTSVLANAPTKPQNEKATKAQYYPNGANVFCFLSSLPLLPTATTAVFGSYLSSLY